MKVCIGFKQAREIPLEELSFTCMAKSSLSASGVQKKSFTQPYSATYTSKLFSFEQSWSVLNRF